MVSEVGSAIDEVRTELAAVAGEFMADTCTIKLITPSSDDFGGSTDSETTVASNIPCDYESLGPQQVIVGGKVVTGRTHKIKLPFTASTAGILPKHKIVVAAQGVMPELTFNDPIILPGSLGPFLEVAATLGVQ